MNIHERLEAFWSGRRPDQIPYTIYRNEWRHTADDPAWEAMYRAGLGVTWHFGAHANRTRDVEVVRTETRQGSDLTVRLTHRTPIGEITQHWVNGWQQEYLLKTAEDYRVMTWIVEHTDVVVDYETFRAKERELPPHAIALAYIGRTPLQTMLVDYAGLEQFVFHMADCEAEVGTLYQALLKNFRRVVEIAAEGPGRFVSCLENFTAESLGPERYGRWLMPVYQECFPALRRAGKIVGCHYDGRTASCRELIARAPFDLVESLTEPPEGDQPLAEARAAWPDKLFWCNIRVGDYQLPPKALRRKVLEMVEQAAPDGRRLAFEVSEYLPANWKESMPVVLDALRETRVV